MSFRRNFGFGALAAGALALGACDDSGSVSQRSLRPIPAETLALMEQAGTTKDAPTLIRTYKKEAEFEIWKMRSDGRYVHLKTFPMCRWSGQLGPKVREGDRQVPEGFYAIAPGQLNPNSAYYLSFNVGYPNAYDRAWGHTGGTIMVHGACSSAGCFSMTDKQIAEIYAITRTSLSGGQHAIQMQSFPFKMTAENLAKHRLDLNIGFWKQLKEGSDHFEVTKQEPRVAFCGRRYVFGVNGQGLDANAACPPLRQDEETKALVAEKAARDDAKVEQLAASGVTPVKVVYQDGGQNPVFHARVADVSRPEAIAAAPVEIALEDKASKAAAKSVTRLAAKNAAKDAARSPVVTMAAAKDGSSASAAQTIVASSAAKPSESAADPAEFSALAPDQGGSISGSIKDWLGSHKNKDRPSAAEAQAPEELLAGQPKPVAAARPRHANDGQKRPAGPLEQALRDTNAPAARR